MRKKPLDVAARDLCWYVKMNARPRLYWLLFDRNYSRLQELCRSNLREIRGDRGRRGR